MNKTIEKMIADYEIGDLLRLVDELNARVESKRQETRILIWRVIDRGVCYGNFAEHDYLKALDCLKDTGTKRWSQLANEQRKNRDDTDELALCIVAEFYPESDAREYLK
ncbi:hypothetical protein ACP7OL_004609 [Salmonella enterica subsp. enterica]